MRRSAGAKLLHLARVVVGGYGTARISPTPLSCDTGDRKGSASFVSGRMGPQALPVAATCRAPTLASGGAGDQASEGPGLRESDVDAYGRRAV